MENNNQHMVSPDRIHTLSLALAALFAEAYKAKRPKREVSALLESYRSLRRAIPKDPETGQRLRSCEAYQATQGQRRGTLAAYTYPKGLGGVEGTPELRWTIV